MAKSLLSSASEYRFEPSDILHKLLNNGLFACSAIITIKNSFKCIVSCDINNETRKDTIEMCINI